MDPETVPSRIVQTAPPLGRHLNRREFVGLLTAMTAAFYSTRLLGGAQLPSGSSDGKAFLPASGAMPAPVEATSAQAESTRQMAALLEKIRREADPLKNPFRSAEQVPLLREMLAKPGLPPQQEFQLRGQLILQLLQSSESEKALSENEALQSFVIEKNLPLDGHAISQMQLMKALCHLRIGEQENCLLNHNADSCIFPIAGGGVHTLPRGSRGAIAVLTELLEKSPRDLRARWLLNLAYMTLGEHPQNVPAKWLIDAKLFESGENFPRYPDVAANVGLDIEGHAGGIVLEDFDNDGFLDVMVSSWDLTDQLRFFHNNGDGTFSERTAAAGLVGEVGGLNLVSCDYNNDGLMDVLVLRGAWLHSEGKFPLSLLRNNGDGTFTDVTVEAGLLRFHPSGSAVWFDYNNDGWLDLFVVNESDENEVHRCELFRNNGDGTFTECAKQHGVDLVGYFKGVTCGDYNNDGRTDLFLSQLNGPKILLRNDGPSGDDRSPHAPWKFTDVAEHAGLIDPPDSFPCWFWDFDNDGWLDLFVTGYKIQDVGDIAADYLGLPHAGQLARLYRNNRDGTFSDISREYGVNKLLLGMGANFGDLTNDGWLDMYIGTGDPNLATLIPNRMFRNDSGKRFIDVTTAGGFGQLQKGHGIAFGDINNNGSQDIFSVVGGAAQSDYYNRQIFANPGHGNNWIKLKLEGVQTNRAAFGARVKVVVENDGSDRSIHRVVCTGGSFGSSPIRQEIGVGVARKIKRVEIFWPVTGATQVFENLDVNRFYKIKEGATLAQLVPLKTFPWPAASLHHHHHHMGAM